MDTIITIKLPKDKADEGFALVQEEITRLENTFSVTKSQSEIYQLNHKEGKPVALSEEVFSLIQKAERIKSLTAGAFDCSVYSLMQAWGFFEKSYHTPDEQTLQNLVEALSSPVMNPETFEVSTLSGIDLGGIAKGYSATLLAEKLKNIGVTSGVLSLGGNVQLIGSKPDGSPWMVGITNPFSPQEILFSLSLRDTAVVTSGSYQRYFETEGVVYHHILDPKTGYPANNGLSSVTVITPDGAWADGFSTALYVMGTEEALRFAKSQKDVGFILITDNQKIYVSSSLKSAVHSTVAGNYTWIYL